MYALFLCSFAPFPWLCPVSARSRPGLPGTDDNTVSPQLLAQDTTQTGLTTSENTNNNSAVLYVYTDCYTEQ